MEGYASMEHPRLLDVVEQARWQKVQDHFAGVLGIPIRTVNPVHELLVSPSWPSGFAVDRAIESLKIGEELDTLLPIDEPLLEISSLTTSLSITYAAVPTRATAERIVAYFVTRPMIVGPREDEAQFRRRVSSLGHNPQALWPLLLSLKLYSFSSIRSVLHLLEEVGTSLVQLACQAKQLTMMMPATARMDQAVGGYYADRVLHTLLEAAVLAAKAEGGSVMLYENDDTLRIKAAEGLSEEIIAQTRIKRGEGIAGLAATQHDVLLVDEQTGNEQLKELMRQPQLASSLVAPLAPDPKREPIGVLNLRTTNHAARFTQEHVELLKRLTELASIALKSVLPAANPST